MGDKASKRNASVFCFVSVWVRNWGESGLLFASQAPGMKRVVWYCLRPSCGEECSENITWVVLIILRGASLYQKKYFLRSVGCPWLPGVPMDLATCCSTWPWMLFSLSFFLPFGERFEVFSWLRWTCCLISYVHLSLFFILSWRSATHNMHSGLDHKSRWFSLRLGVKCSGIVSPQRNHVLVHANA